jgi:hypothetical protein
MPANHVHTYQVSYYGPDELVKEPEERGYPKHRRTRSTSATRAINEVLKHLESDARSAGDEWDRRKVLVLEAKVVA